MKKGQVKPVTELLSLALRAVAVIALFAILWMYVFPFLFPPKSPEVREFERLLHDIDKVMEQPYDGEELLRFPVLTSLIVVSYAGGPSGPIQCKGRPCICLGESGKETCKVYNSLEVRCPAECGEVQCLKNGIGKVEAGALAVKRGCNNLGFA